VRLLPNCVWGVLVTVYCINHHVISSPFITGGEQYGIRMQPLTP
jgi:hypothetical protein